MQTPNSPVELKKALDRSREIEQLARQSAEKANEEIARLRMKLDTERMYSSFLMRSIDKLKKAPPKIVEVPVMVEVVPEHIRQRLIQLSKEAI